MNNDLFETFKMPGGVAGWRLPEISAPVDIAPIAASKAVLEELGEMITAYRVGRPSRALSIAHLDAANAAIVAQVLGEGEVSVILGDGSDLSIQESVMPGLWHVVGKDCDYLEVADVPATVRAAIARQEQREPQLPETLPEGTMNVLPVLAEIGDFAKSWTPGSVSREIVLTLLPMTPVDLDVLGQSLGQGEITLLSRGYGNCRVQSLGVRHVWRVTYFNSDDKMILDIIEVGDVPTAAVAAQEDIDDAQKRLSQIMEAYF